MLELNARHPLHTFRCGTVRFFNNIRPEGTVLPGWTGATAGHYVEPETLAEDAFMAVCLGRVFHLVPVRKHLC